MGRRGDRRRAGTVVATVLVVLTAACTGGGGSGKTDDLTTATTEPRRAVDEGTPEPGGSIVLALNAETSGFHPLIDRFAVQGHFVASAIFDPLARVDEDGEVEPFLAETIEPNDDATVWTITIPEGVLFHDGSELTAGVVGRNLQTRVSSPEGIFTLGPIEEVIVTSPTSVEVRMNQPWVAFDFLLTQQLGYVVSTSMLDAYPAYADPVGTGPFRLDEWEPDSHVELVRNPDYWREGLPYLDSIRITPIVSGAGRVSALEAGDVDAIFSVDPADIDRYRGNEDFEMVEDGLSEENMIMLNAGRPPFDRYSAREAVVRATDVDLLNSLVYDGLLEPATSPFAPGERWYTSDDHYPTYDADAAREAVARYEQESGEELSLVLTVISGSEGLELGQALIEMWNAVGISAELEDIDQTVYIQRLTTGDLQAGHLANFGYTDPDFLYLFFHSDNSQPPGDISINFSHTESDDLDAALLAGRGATDPAEREQAYADMVRIINDELAYIWLNHRLAAIIAHPHVNGLAVAEATGFSRVDSKPWLSEIWVDQP